MVQKTDYTIDLADGLKWVRLVCDALSTIGEVVCRARGKKLNEIWAKWSAMEYTVRFSTSPSRTPWCTRTSHFCLAERWWKGGRGDEDPEGEDDGAWVWTLM